MKIIPEAGKFRDYLLYLLYIAVLLPPCLEVALRVLGYRPFHQVEYHIEARPQNCIIAHPTLGFALLPGRFEVTINKGLHYSVRHGSDSLRMMSFQREDNPGRGSIYLFGCSFTYGMGVSDSLTFPYLLQQALPDHNVKNFGVPGYGTVQAFGQLKQLIASNNVPDVMIINYADFHDERNSLTPAYRRDLYLGYQRSHKSVKSLMQRGRIPYLGKSEHHPFIQFCSWENIYHPWKYRESFACVNFLQELADQNQARTIDTAGNTRRIFAMIRELCAVRHIRLIVTGVTHTEKTKQLLQDLAASGIETLDISVDLSLEKYRNAPYDDHPNKWAHVAFAEKILTYLLP